MNNDVEYIKRQAIANYRNTIKEISKLFKDCCLKADPVAFVDSGKNYAQAKEFAFHEMRKMLSPENRAKMAAQIAEKQKTINELRLEMEQYKNKVMKPFNAEQVAAIKLMLKGQKEQEKQRKIDQETSKKNRELALKKMGYRGPIRIC